MRAFYLFLFLASSLFSNYPDGERKGNLSLIHLESASTAIVDGCVNAITGEFFQSVNDIQITGAEPLYLERYLGDKLHFTYDEHSWEHFAFNITSKVYPNINPCVREGNGGLLELQKIHKHHDRFECHLNRNHVKFGVTNFSEEVLGRKNHLRFIKLFVNKKETHAVYEHPNGTQRIYEKIKLKDNEDDLLPTRENRPSGAYQTFEYIPIYGISKVTLKARNGEELSSIRFEYPSKKQLINNPYFDAIGSNGQRVRYHLRKENKRVTFNISKVEKSYAPSERIKVKRGQSCNELVRVKYPECRYREAHLYHYGTQDTRQGTVKIKYNGTNANNAEMFIGRVHKLRAPVGTDAFAVTTHEFIYHTPLIRDQETGLYKTGRGSTSLYDAHGYKTCYHWNDSFQFDKVEKFTGTQNHSLYSTEYFRYDNSGQLTQRYFDKANEGVLFCRQFLYDQHGNVVEDQLWGNLTGQNLDNKVKIVNGTPVGNGADILTKKFKYTGDRFHNLAYETDGFQETFFEYQPDTDILTAKFYGSIGKIEAREFYEYNARGELICKVCDDGETRDRNNLQGVMCRKIERREMTNGLPTIIEERFFDLATGQELLEGKQCIRYSQTGKPLEEHHYDSDGQFLYSLNKEYDAHDNLIMASDPLGIITRFSYDKNDNLILQERDEIQKVKTYDFSNRLIKEEILGEGNYQSQSHRYNYLSQKTDTTDHWGNKTTYTYDDFGRPIQEQAPSYFGPDQSLITPTIQRSYDATGNVTKLTTSSGYEINSLYNVRGDLIHSWDQDGTLQRCEYSLNGWLVKKVERSGLETRYTYDFLGRTIKEELYSLTGEFIRGTTAVYKGTLKLSETDSSGIETRYSYNFRGQCIARETYGAITTFTYDSQGRIVREQLEDTLKTTTYDHFNRIIEESTDGIPTKKSYDSHDRLIEEQQGEKRTLTAYNPLGLPVKITDSEGRVTVITYNDNFVNVLGQKVRLVTISQPNGTRSETEYNSHGMVARESTYSTMGELLQESINFYDFNGKLAETVSAVIARNKSPYNRKICFQYDPQGRLVAVRDGAGSPDQKTTLYFYNTLGQKNSETQANEISLNYTYDVLGRLSTLDSTDYTVSYLYEYDEKDNVVLVQDRINGTTTESEYDALNQLTREKLANNLTLNYTYDTVGRLTTMVLPDHTAVTYTYKGSLLDTVSRNNFTHTYVARNTSGRVIEERLPSGEIRTTTYAPNEQKLEINTNGFVDKVVTRDVSGNVTQRTLQQKDLLYQWDQLHQLSQENNQSYIHDSLYNRTQKGRNEYSLNLLNQVLHDGENTYKYDSNGNLIAGRGMTFEYDALNRMVAANTPKGKVHYQYDSQNRRISTTATETTNYFYFGMNELGAVSPSKRELRVFGESEGAERGAGVLFEINGEVFIPLYDLTGNIVQLKRPNGTIVEEYSYDLYGIETSHNPLSPWRYSSKRVDVETGFVYFGYRYYDPTLGRWITADPRGYTAGPNLYAYVMNNPIAHMDQYGHVSESTGQNDGKNPSRKVIRFGKKSLVPNALKRCFQNFPEVRDPLKFTKVKLSSKLNPSCWKISDGKTTVFSLNYDKEPEKYFIVFVNGMANTLEDAIESTKLISQAHDNMNVYLLHNPTNGVFLDILYAGLQKIGFYTETCQHIEIGFNNLFEKFPDKSCVAYNHSKGVIICAKVFKRLSSENQSKIYSTSFGGAGIIKPKGLGGAMNYLSSRDGVLLFSSPWEYTRNVLKGKDYVQVLDGCGLYGLDHSFSSKTYQKGLSRAAENIDLYFRNQHE